LFLKCSKTLFSLFQFSRTRESPMLRSSKRMLCQLLLSLVVPIAFVAPGDFAAAQDFRQQNFRQRDQQQGEPGKFDFYVLALSWSPSFCEASRERPANRTPDQQCGARPYSFVVHGLWPQYERGFPSNCQVPAP